MNNPRKIGLGTAAIGRPHYINLRQQQPTEGITLADFRQNGIKLLDFAYEQGVRYFDTAPGYGMAEDMLTEWVATKDDSSIEIATKWGYTYVANFNSGATDHEIKEHSLAKLNEQWEQSKKILPWLTSYQIHSATLDTGVLDNLNVLQRLAELKKEHGLLIGITSTGVEQTEIIKKALAVKVDGEELFDVFQVTYNIFDQSLASIISDFHGGNKRLVIKEALANGRIFPNNNYPHYAKAYLLLQNLAKKYNVGIDAIALEFCHSSIPAYSVLSGASAKEHLTANLATEDFQLDQVDLISLRQLASKPLDYWRERSKLNWN